MLPVLDSVGDARDGFAARSLSAVVARLFNALEAGPSNAPAEVFPGRPGLVVAGGELRSMVWGFPLSLKV